MAAEDDRSQFELLALLMEAIADGFLDWDLRTGVGLYSERLKLILGYEDIPAPSSPLAWLDLAHADDRDDLSSAIEGLISGEWPLETQFRCKDPLGGWRWLRARGAASRDSDGRARRLVIAFANVTAEVRAGHRLRSLLNAVPDLLIRVAANSEVLDAKVPEDDILYREMVPSPGELLCQSPITKSWWQSGEEALRAALSDRKITHFEAQALDSQGVRRDIEVRVLPSTEDEALFVLRDITDEKQRREQGLQSQKLEAIGQLAAGIAHEINTPLQFVGDNLHFLSEAAQALTQMLDGYRARVSPDAAPALRQMESELDIDYMSENLLPAFASAIEGVQRVTVIVQAMKAFTHPGRKEKRPEDLNQALQTTITLTTNVWKYVAEVKREFAPTLPYVTCVIGEINQIFLNLITNAAHAIAEVVGESGEKGTIHISTLQREGFAEIRISDTGAGIPEAIRSRVFEPFFTTKPVGKGTGQGLPLARAIVLQHQGTLHFETAEGAGTTFVVRLPIAASASPPANSSR